MSRRLSKIGQGIGPYLQPAFVSKLKCDNITSLNLHSNDLHGLEVCYYYCKEGDGQTKNKKREQGNEFLEQKSIDTNGLLPMLVDMDVSSNKLGGKKKIHCDHDNKTDDTNNAVAGSYKCNNVGGISSELRQGDAAVGVSILLLAPNLKSINFSANCLSSQDLGRIFQPIGDKITASTSIYSSSSSPMMRQLLHLNLSFNELQSLPDTFHTVCPCLCKLILVGNFVSNVSSVVKPLYPIRHSITSIMLQEYDGSSPNPICSHQWYRERMIRFFPNLENMDRVHVSAEEKHDAATSIDGILLEQHESEEEEEEEETTTRILPGPFHRKAKICVDSNVTLFKNERCSNKPLEGKPDTLPKSSTKRNLQSSATTSFASNGKFDVGIGYASSAIVAANVGTIPTYAEKTASRRIDTMESKMMLLKAIAEEQAKATQNLLSCEHRNSQQGDVKRRDDDGNIKGLNNVRFLVHQECQVDSKVLAPYKSQPIEVQTDHVHFLASSNREAQTSATISMSNDLEKSTKFYIALASLSFLRKVIQSRKTVENKLLLFSFYCWRSRIDAFRRKEQVRKVHQSYKNAALARRKWKGALLECEEKLCSSEIHQGRLQQKISHLVEEMKQQHDLSLTAGQNHQSMYDQLKEAERAHVGLNLTIINLQAELQALELDRLKECKRVESVSLDLEQYKIKCSALQTEVNISLEQLQENKHKTEARLEEIARENQEALEKAQQVALTQYKRELMLTREKADKQVRQMKHAYEDIAKVSATDRANYEQAATDRKALEESSRRLKAQLFELHSLLVTSKGQVVALEQEIEQAKEDTKSCKHLSRIVELRNSKLAAALVDSKERIAHYENELKIKKRSESHCTVATDRLQEKIESMTRETEELEYKCKMLTRDRDGLNDELAELRNKFEKMIPGGLRADNKLKTGRSREKAIKRIVKEHLQRITSLEIELTEKSESFRYCEGELVGLRRAYQGKESTIRREFDQEVARMQQSENIKNREVERRMKILEEERAGADERRLRAETGLACAEQKLTVERDTRVLAEQEVNRLTRLLEDQIARTKTAVQGLLL